MIKIKGEFENGAQMRQELMSLLGLDGNLVISSTIKGEDLIIQTSPIVATETAAPAVEEKKKRRTKAEIEAEAKALEANTGSEEPPASVDADTSQAPEGPVSADQAATDQAATDQAATETAPAATTVTLEDAKLATAKLARAGFRDEAKELAYKYAVMTNPDVAKDHTGLVRLIAEENLAAFIAEIEAVNQ